MLTDHEMRSEYANLKAKWSGVPWAAIREMCRVAMHHGYFPEQSAQHVLSWVRSNAPEGAQVNAVIVTRHPATVEWLRAEVPALRDARVVASATVPDVAGKLVYGNVPYHLARHAAMVYAVEFAADAPRGAEYTVEDMRQAGAHLRAYTVQSLQGEG